MMRVLLTIKHYVERAVPILLFCVGIVMIFGAVGAGESGAISIGNMLLQAFGGGTMILLGVALEVHREENET